MFTVSILMKRFDLYLTHSMHFSVFDLSLNNSTQATEVCINVSVKPVDHDLQHDPKNI